MAHKSIFLNYWKPVYFFMLSFLIRWQKNNYVKAFVTFKIGIFIVDKKTPVGFLRMLHTLQKIFHAIYPISRRIANILERYELCKEKSFPFLYRHQGEREHMTRSFVYVTETQLRISLGCLWSTRPDHRLLHLFLS